MMDVLMKIWFLIFVLPFIILQSGYLKLKDYLLKNHNISERSYTLYAILIALIIILIVLLSLGFRW